MLRALLDLGRIVLIGLAIIAVSGLIGTFMGETVGNLSFVVLAIVAFFFERHFARKRRARLASEHMRPTRACPFCEQGTLHMDYETGVAQTQGRRTVWYYSWQCDRCNYWILADLIGNPVPQPPQ